VRHPPAPFYDPFKGSGKPVRVREDKVVWYVEQEDGQIATCVQTIVQPLLDANREELHENAGKRWNDGRVLARLPMDIYFRIIAPARKAGDEAYVRKILNDGDYAKFRTFPGKI
jgi:hypothetical protein